jgi:predicted GTPase
MEKQIEKEKTYNKDMNKLYNMIIKVNSMDQLTKEGWKIINNRSENSKCLEKKVSIISVIGNKNSGKSFVLHLLTGKNIPNGYTVTKEGLSFIIPEDEDNKEDNFILIDTAGTESPLLIEGNNNLTLEIKDKMAKDRQITDYFLQKFILEKSDIFIFVL